MNPDNLPCLPDPMAGWVNESAPAPTADGSAFNPIGLLKSTLHRWPLAVGLGLVLAAAAAIPTWFLIPAKYTTFAVVRVLSVEPSLLPDPNRAGPQDNSYQRTQVAMIKSHRVLRDALQKPGVAEFTLVREQPYPIEWLDRELQVGIVEGTELIRVSMSGMHPEEITALVNNVVDSYMGGVVLAERNLRRDKLKEIESALVIREKELDEKKKRLETAVLVTSTTESTALVLRQQIALDGMRTAQNNLENLQSTIRGVEGELAVHRAGFGPVDKTHIPESAIAAELALDPVYRQYQEQADVLAEQAKELQKTIKPELFPNERVVRDMGSVKKRMDEMSAERRPAILKRLQLEVWDKTDLAIKLSTKHLDYLKLQETNLKQKLKERQDEAEKLGRNTTQIEFMRREIQENERVADSLRSARERLRVDIESANNRVTPFEAASVPQLKNIKTQIGATALAGIFGLALGLFGVGFWEYQSRRINSSHEVVQNLGMRVVGTLPAMPAGPRRGPSRSNPVEDEYWNNLLIESIDGIRTLLLCDSKNQSHRVLMVTSARESEGKTTLASHLASSIARSGRKVLLVDGDQRRPGIHRMFNLPLEPGLSEILRGEAELGEAIHPGPVAGLFILSAGLSTWQTIQALSQDGIRGVLERARTEFDFVVVDSCPVVPVADSLLMGQHVDAVLLAVRPHVSQAPWVYLARERLQTLGIQILGTVVVGENFPTARHQYLYLGHADSPVS